MYVYTFKLAQTLLIVVNISIYTNSQLINLGLAKRCVINIIVLLIKLLTFINESQFRLILTKIYFEN